MMKFLFAFITAVRAEPVTFGMRDLAVWTSRTVAFSASKFEFVHIPGAAMRAHFITIGQPP